MDTPVPDITELLTQVSQRSPEAEAKLYRIVYEELRRMARNRMRRENPNHTLQPTALVNEAYVRLARDDRSWKNRAHFYAAAAQTMRCILVDHARAKLADKRGAGAVQVELLEFAAPAVEPSKMVALDEALSRLASMDQRQARVVELRFFAGMKEHEIAEILGVNVRTVKRDWAMARAWLYAQIGT